QSLEDEVKDKAICSSCKGDSLKNKQGSTELLGKMKEAIRQATVEETNWRATQDVCMIHKENLSLFCLEDQIPLCSLCRKSWDHAGHTVISKNQPENQATGNVLNGHPTQRKGQELNYLDYPHTICHSDCGLGNHHLCFYKKECETTLMIPVQEDCWTPAAVYLACLLIGHLCRTKLPSAAATASCCPTGWHMNQGNCYHVLETQESWNASQNRCLSLGATLAVFGDLEKLIVAMNVREPFNHWIGLHRSSEDRWIWPDGSLFKNNGGRRRLCLLEEQSSEQRRLCHLEERTVQPERVNEPQTLQGNMTSKEFLLEKKKGVGALH
ncbi:C-type lectin domain family 2 member E, partial [Ophiophagus hannah]